MRPHSNKGRKHTPDHVAKRVASRKANYRDSNEKTCSTCGQVKPKTEFHTDRSSRSGCQSDCRKCSQIDRKRLYDPVKNRDRQIAIKREVMYAYGKECYCCGEADLRFLTLDHVNDDGVSHRRIAKSRGISFYYWLKMNKCPTDVELRVSCFNCNCARRSNLGVCPHEEARANALHLAA